VDKKVQDGRLRLVLLEALGAAVVTADFDPAVLDATLAATASGEPSRPSAAAGA
jgi:3-dehydroquinate synthase